MPELLGGHYEPLKRRSISEDFEEVIIQPYMKGLLVLSRTRGWASLSDWLARQGNVVSKRGRPTVLKNCRIRFEWDIEDRQDLTGDVSTQFPFPNAHPPSVLPEKGDK